MTIGQSHILVIDDNEDILVMIETLLKFNGYKVTIRSNVENIESFIKELSPDAILMDMLLSGADGREVCKQLKSNTAFSHIPVIMISAHPLARAECLKAGANYFLEKPFEMQDLFEVIHDAVS
ncbi:MAG: response regulator [Bacteroidota bacterium]